MAAKNSHFYPVVLAGGSGTRFWPRSRKRLAKQLLALESQTKETMIQRTVSRLLPLAAATRIWVISNEHLAGAIRQQLRRLVREQVIAEPAARNTAPAIGLAAFLLVAREPAAIIGMFPSDQVITNETRFRKAVIQALAVAAAGDNIVVMGVKPTRPETGYGYIEVGKKAQPGLYRVKRFTEKPNTERASEFVAAGAYYWNSGMFFWSAQTLVRAIREHLPDAAPHLERIAAAYGTKNFARVFARLYPRCEDISIDYAVLEPRSARGESRSNLYCIAANFGWNDLGSWNSLYEHHATRSENKAQNKNVIQAKASFSLDAGRNYIYSPGKFVAAIGVDDLVVVETNDALLVTTRNRAQDVAKVVQHLKAKKMSKLL